MFKELFEAINKIFKEFLYAIDRRKELRERRDKHIYWQGWCDGVKYARNANYPQILGNIVNRQIEEILEKNWKIK